MSSDIESVLLAALEGAKDWLDSPSIINELRRRGRSPSYSTVKAALLRMGAEGKVLSRKIGSGRRGSWIFRVPKREELNRTVAKMEPISLTPEARRSYSLDEMIRLYETLYASHGEQIKEHFRRTGARYIVLCAGELALTSSKPQGPSEAQLTRIERKYGRACYVIGADVFEESLWSDLGRGDFYPTLTINVGQGGWKDDEVFSKGNRLVADFDTGNPDVTAFDIEELGRIEIEPASAPEIRSDLHLGRPYYYVWRKLKLGFSDAKTKRTFAKLCKCVLRWKKREWNPFLIASPARVAFAGRDLMLKLPFAVSLNPKKRLTAISLL